MKNVERLKEDQLKSKLEELREDWDRLDANHPHKQSEVTQQIQEIQERLKKITGKFF